MIFVETELRSIFGPTSKEHENGENIIRSSMIR